MSSRRALDTGVACTPTPRAVVFPTGQPAAIDATDADVAANTVLRADTFNPVRVNSNGAGRLGGHVTGLNGRIGVLEARISVLEVENARLAAEVERLEAGLVHQRAEWLSPFDPQARA